LALQELILKIKGKTIKQKDKQKKIDRFKILINGFTVVYLFNIIYFTVALNEYSLGYSPIHVTHIFFFNTISVKNLFISIIFPQIILQIINVKLYKKITFWHEVI
jgi:hypothetical protein